jgi:Cu(I)/Ag(I) efflux system membrane fusion protein
MKISSNLSGKTIVQAIGIMALITASMWIGNKMGTNKSAPPQKQEYATTEKTTATVWTCSMHPQIKMNKAGKCPICFMDLIALSESRSGPDDTSGATRLSMSENAKILAGIITVPAIRHDVNSVLRITGKVALDETRLEMITARISGRIDRLYVDYVGIPVSSGDHLAQIYSPELLSLQQELLQASRAVANIGSDASAMVRNSVQRTFEAAKEKLRLLGFPDTELLQILERGTTSDHMTIRAGQRGVVLQKLVQKGAYVQTGTPLFHIGDVSKLWVMMDAYESDMAWIRLGQKVLFTVEAFPGLTFSGTVSFIDPVVNPQTRTSKVRAIVDNSDGRLKPDMFIKASIKVQLSKSGEVKNASLRGKWISPMHPQIVKDGPGTCDICGMPLVRAEELGYVTSGFEDVEPLVIPATAPLYTGERSIVYVEIPGTGEPTFEAREVVLGPRVEGYYIVKSGISEGEKVVVNGAFKIDGELQIRAKPSMMNPEGTVTASGHAGHDMSVMSGKDTHTVPQSVPSISNNPVSGDFTAALVKFIDGYLAVADALAGDDLKGAKTGFENLKNLASSVKAGEGEQYEAWRSSLKEIDTALKHSRHAAEIADARSIFEKLSRQIITLEKHYLGNDGIDHFIAFCPMAFNNNGAYWVQKTENIHNPYFGSKMLKCGEIKEKL